MRSRWAWLGWRGCCGQFAADGAGGKCAAEVEALGRRTLRVASDVLERASVQALLDAVMKDFGKVDILVNAAGITFKAPTLDLDELTGSV